MRYEVDVNGKRRQVTLERREGRLVVSTGGREWLVDAASVGTHTLSLLVEQVRLKPDPTDPPVDTDPVGPGVAVGHGVLVGSGFSRTLPVLSHEISIATDPVSGQFVFGVRGVPVVAGLRARRRWGSRDDGSAGSGPQRIVAPMPGRVVRVLTRPGDVVQRRQPILVVEAMKMENELRAAGDGKVAEVLVKEGQSVEAGALLAIVVPQ